MSHINEGKLGEALEILDHIIGSTRGPHNTGAHIARGTARAMLHDLEGAAVPAGAGTLKCTRAIFCACPPSCSMWLWLASVHAAAAGAVDDFTVTIKSVPSYGDAWMRRGQARAALGQDEDALADLLHCLELTPGRCAPGPERAAPFDDRALPQRWQCKCAVL